MDIHQQLSSLLSDCVWTSTTGEALRHVPALATDLPAMVRLPGESDLRIPLSDSDLLVETVARTLAAASSRVLSGGMGQRVDQLNPDELAHDPLVRLLEAQFFQLGWPGVARDSAPLLAVAWASSRLLSGKVGELRLRETALVRQVEKLADRLQGMDPVARGEALAGLAWEVSGRAAAAISLAGQGGRSLRSVALARTLLPSRLLMSFPRGTLDEEVDLAMVGSILGLGLEPRVVSLLTRVVDEALSAHCEREKKGELQGVDIALQQAYGGRVSGSLGRKVLLHPVAGPLLVGSLGALVSPRALRRAGLERADADAFGDPIKLAAIAGTWKDLVGSLCEWDVLSSLVERVSWIRRTDRGEWSYGRKRLDGEATWELLLPRMVPLRPLSVVAVRFTDVRRLVDLRARDTGRNSSAGVVERAWKQFCDSRDIRVYDWGGDHGVAAFLDPLVAIGFAREALESFSGPYELPIGARGGAVSIPSGLRVSAGIAFGQVIGGSDGIGSRLHGPAVGAAISLSGSAALDRAAEDSGGYRRAAFGRGGLCSEGMIVESEFLEELSEAIGEGGEVVRGPVKPGDDGRGFEFFPVLCWWESRGGVVVVMGLLDGSRGGSIAEIIDMSAQDFDSFCDADRVAGRMERGRKIRAREKAPIALVDGAERESDDIDAIFLGTVAEEPEPETPLVFAPDPIAVVARDADSETWSGEVVGAPMLLDEKISETRVDESEPEVPGPAVFIDDDWDSDGWEENSWVDEDWGDEASAAKVEPSAPDPVAVRAAVRELMESHVVIRSDGAFFFGKLDGPSLRGALESHTAGDTLEAYKALLAHHLSDGDDAGRSGVMGVRDDWIPESLDLTLLERAVSELGW